MAILRSSLDQEIQERHAEHMAFKAEHEREQRERRNLAARAKRRGLLTSVQAQREWIKANPCGFEIGGGSNG